jgi:hypothetical protein
MFIGQWMALFDKKPFLALDVRPGSLVEEDEQGACDHEEDNEYRYGPF